MRAARAWGLIALVVSLVAVPTADAAPLRLDGRFGQGGVARAPFGYTNVFPYFGLQLSSPDPHCCRGHARRS